MSRRFHQIRHTNIPKALINLQPLEQLHAPDIRNVHLEQLRCVEVALDKHALCSIFGQL